jgi:Putative polyhydroxyalkanoic acid system protein (PHA_gran_rgn)
VSTPVTATVPHRLGKDEALRRLKAGLARAKGQFGTLITIEQEEWSGDVLRFQMRALGQSAAGTITVMEDSLLIAVTLPWLLAKAAERLLPQMRQQATVLLEHK